MFSALSAAASERSQQRQKEAFLPQSEAGRAGMRLQELSLGKKKEVKPPKTPRREGLEQVRGEGTIIIFAGFSFLQNQQQEWLNLDFCPQNE